MPKQLPANLKEQVPPEKRIALDQRSRINVQLARTLLREKNYKEAFKQFKRALATPDGTDLFPNTADMAKLARNYRPAMAALKRWRDQKEKLILAQTADSTVIYQWQTLNVCLKDRDRILTVFRNLQTAGADEELLAPFYSMIWKRLVKKKQYPELTQFFKTLGWMTLLDVSDYHAEKWFPRENSLSKSPQRIIEDGALFYETAIALNENDSANVILEKLLSVDDSDSTYALLIKAARRARAKDSARALFQQARERLGARRVRKSRQALGALIKSG